MAAPSSKANLPRLVVAPKLVTIKTTMITTAVNAGIPSAIQRRMSW
jgi:hypothetical protein